MEVADDQNGHSIYDWSWFWRGMRNLFSIPALILVSAFVGFGGLAREADIPLEQLVFMVPLIWALPSHLLLVAGIVADAPLLAVAAAVALAAVRLMPMTMALVPEIRVPGSRVWHLLLISNMVAITAWVHTLQKAPEIPRRGRLPYFCGMAAILMVATTSVAATVYQLAATFPPVLMAALYFLTPLYFAASIWNTARFTAEHVALVLGFCLGPALYLLVPEINILAGGIIGGFAAFGVHQLIRQKTS